MAHSLSAKKRVRQNEKRHARNRARKTVVRAQVKDFLGALSTGDVAKAEIELQKATKQLDKVAACGTIHKNTASRRRSRLARRLNAAKAAGGTAAATA